MIAAMIAASLASMRGGEAAAVGGTGGGVAWRGVALSNLGGGA
jgi:hypothetical protein